MKKEMTVCVRGEVQGLDRHRMTKAGHSYDTTKNVENKLRIIRKAESVAMAEGIVLPIPPGPKGYSVVIFARMKPPKSYSKKRLKAIQDGKERPQKKPDNDNIAKLWLDAFVRGGILEDDKHVTSLVVQKVWSDVDETECWVYWEENEK